MAWLADRRRLEGLIMRLWAMSRLLSPALLTILFIVTALLEILALLAIVIGPFFAWRHAITVGDLVVGLLVAAAMFCGFLFLLSGLSE
jgi:hypothetical protein